MDGTFRMFSFSFCFHIGADKIWLIYGFCYNTIDFIRKQKIETMFQND